MIRGRVKMNVGNLLECPQIPNNEHRITMSFPPHIVNIYEGPFHIPEPMDIMRIFSAAQLSLLCIVQELKPMNYGR